MTKKKAATLPSIPYEPTPAEKRAVASYEKRKAVVPPTPAIVCNISEAGEDGKREAKIKVDHPDTAAGYQMISDALGSGDMTFTYGMLLDASGIAAQPDGTPNVERVNYALSIVKGIKPRDQVEAMLAMQMAAIHMAATATAGYLGASKSAKNIDLHERSLNKLSRTFTTQMEALKRYRSKGGNQRIVVERVNVSDGGQAIVGNVPAANRGEVE